MIANWKLAVFIGAIACVLAVLLSVLLTGREGQRLVQEDGKCELVLGPPLPEESRAAQVQAAQRDAAGAYDIRAAPGWESPSEQCRSPPPENTLREVGECGELGGDHIVCQVGECGYTISIEGIVTLVHDGPRLGLLNSEVDGSPLSTPANGGWNTPYQLTCPGTTAGRSLSMSVLDISDTQGSLGVEMPFATILGRSPDGLVARYNDYVGGGASEVGSFRNYNAAGQERAAMEITFARPYEGIERFVMAVQPFDSSHTVSATLKQNGCTYPWSSWYVGGIVFGDGRGMESGVHFNSCPTTPKSNVLQLGGTTYLDIHVGAASSEESAYWSVITVVSYHAGG